LIEQLFVSEDPIFLYHRGIDCKRVRDVIRETIERKAFGRGASTIAMQLAKVLYLSYDKTLFRKAQQFALAVLMELHYSKDEILAAYLESIPFGEGTTGIQAASRTFFHREPADLSPEQSRVLVVTIPDPALFNPSMTVMPKQPRFASYTITARVHEYGSR